MELSPEEVRILGCLVEKEATTPDVYPLSSNALLLACNQRSSRDPVVDYDESTVTSTLIALRERGLVRTGRGEGSRVYKHSHLLRDALGLAPGELALLSVLMLRGPQTPGELRTRTERQHGFGSLAEVEETLDALARRDPPLARLLPREPGRREARWQHLLGAASAAQPDRGPPAAPGDDRPAAAVDLEHLLGEVAELRARVEALEARLD
jgi:uncharacterized protein YceH (UPF0502 family)